MALLKAREEAPQATVAAAVIFYCFCSGGMLIVNK
jgi:hypothetical protein